MAALAQSAVVVNDTWKEGGTNSRRFLVKYVTLTLTGHGGVSNTIPAALFGMTTIAYARGARSSTQVQLTCGPSYNGTILYFGAGDSGAPQDQTLTVKVIVAGE